MLGISWAVHAEVRAVCFRACRFNRRSAGPSAAALVKALCVRRLHVEAAPGSTEGAPGRTICGRSSMGAALRKSPRGLVPIVACLRDTGAGAGWGTQVSRGSGATWVYGGEQDWECNLHSCVELATPRPSALAELAVPPLRRRFLTLELSVISATLALPRAEPSTLAESKPTRRSLVAAAVTQPRPSPSVRAWASA